MTQITDNALRTHALTPWPACQRPNPLALGLLGQRALPRTLGRRSNLGRWFLI
jgi:hypothetical protein